MNRTTAALNSADLSNVADLNISNLTTGSLALFPLSRPLRRLAEDLHGLVQAGHLQGVELDLAHLDCPCFLLGVAPNKPQFYVELFRGDLDVDFLDGEEMNGQEAPLCVLMNWMDSDTEPTFREIEWETDTREPGTASLEPDFVEDPDFGEVLSQILFMTEAQQTEAQQTKA